LVIVPADTALAAEWTQPNECILVRMLPEALRNIAAREFHANEFDFHRPPPGHIDRKALSIAHMLREEILSGASNNELYIASLTSILAIHILRHYSTAGDAATSDAASPPHGGPAQRRWRDVDAYMRAHLASDIQVAQLAGVAGLSPSHFLRAFREATGKSPHSYLVELRVQRAEELILNSAMPLKAIAQQSGFCNQSHLTATMRRLRLTTPKAVRCARAQ
jgi:AraC family transcriptional regulator